MAGWAKCPWIQRRAQWRTVPAESTACCWVDTPEAPPEAWPLVAHLGEVMGANGHKCALPAEVLVQLVLRGQIQFRRQVAGMSS